MSERLRKITVLSLKPLAFTIILASGLIALGSFVFPGYFQNISQKSKPDSITLIKIHSEEIIPVEAKKAQFEKVIGSLLSVPAGDTFFLGWGGENRAFDLEARRAFFTDEGWLSYLSYIEQQREALYQDFLMFPPNVGKPKESDISFYAPVLKPSSKKYAILEDEKTIFSGEGRRISELNDLSVAGPKFHLNLEIKGNLEKGSKPLIEKWQFTTLKPEAVPNGR